MLSRSLLSLTIAGAFCAASAFPAAALDRRVQIVNNTGYTIVEFYASNTGTSDWQEDILGPDVLPSGSSVMINIDDGTGYCKYDLLAIFDDGDELMKGDVNVCEVGTFTYN